MSAAQTPRPDGRPAPWIAPRVVAGSLFVAAMVAIAAIAAWPIYRGTAYLVLVGVATAVAVLIAVIARWRGWGGWITAGLLAVAFLVIGVPLAVPSRLGGPAELLRGLGDLATGAVVAWKDLVTVDLPVGSYRNLLVPALVVFLVGTCAALLLAWRDDRIAYGAAPIAIGMVSFGLFFGRATVSQRVQIGPLTLYAPLETAIGIAAALTTLLWLAWRSRDERVRALQRAATSSGVRISRRPSAADRRRAVLGAGMVAVAVAAAAIVVPYAARGMERDVLRSAAGPEIDLASAVSPLASYRALFSDERADEVLFTVTSSGALPDRIRLATLDGYDGEVFRSGGSAAVDQARFVRVPSVRDAGEGTPVDMTVTVEGLTGIWMPTPGRVVSVEFEGPRAPALADQFYYSGAAASGVQTAGGGLERGDAYRVEAVEPATSDLAAIDAPGVGTDVAAPDSLRTWVDHHATGSDGAALAGLVSLLRERGYLSHALDVAEGETAVWMQSLADYTFQPSASGHSLARIDALFQRLLEREADPRADETGNYVAAIGDDEQFAVAVALIARELGFPSRVVVGARLTSADESLAACDGGVCRAQDLAAWAEVQSADGEWIAVDATPQHAQSPSLEVTEQRDPQNVTEVRPDTVDEVVPPDPVEEDTRRGSVDDEETALDLAWLWPVLRITGIVLLLLAVALGPFVVIVIAKAARRHGRRTQGTAAARLAGGWDEYVDAALDAGREVPRALTRSELAAEFATPRGPELAKTADRAVFAPEGATDAEAHAYWNAVNTERRVFIRQLGVWRRIAATVSLKSFVRHVTPPTGRRSSPRTAGRETRRAGGLARTAA